AGIAALSPARSAESPNARRWWSRRRARHDCPPTTRPRWRLSWTRPSCTSKPTCAGTAGISPKATGSTSASAARAAPTEVFRVAQGVLAPLRRGAPIAAYAREVVRLYGRGEPGWLGRRVARLSDTVARAAVRLVLGSRVARRRVVFDTIFGMKEAAR